MGTDQSTLNSTDPPTLNDISNKLSSYNWIPSFSVLTPLTSHITSTPDNPPVTEYVDLRRNIPLMNEENTDYLQVTKAVAILINYCLLNSKSLNTFPPSFYYLSYLLKHVTGTDQLHSFGHISEIIRNFGICSNEDYLNYKERPTDETFNLARPYRHIKFVTVPLVLSVIKRLLAEETPLLVGMPIYSNFLKTETEPRLTLTNGDDILLGGFCGIIVGYQDTDQHFIILTTKGKRWGDRGYIFVPYQQMLNSGAEIVKLELITELIKLDNGKRDHLTSRVSVDPGGYTSHENNVGDSLKTVF